MKYAVIKASGAQYRVAEGEGLDIFQIEGKEGDKVVFKEVLLYEDGDKILVGQPLVKGAVVKAIIVKDFRGEKIRVATYKAKSRYRRVKGHRDELTRVKIESIQIGKEEKPADTKTHKTDPKTLKQKKTVKVTKVAKKTK